jgi:DNA-3-methyladenine glycosylase II
MNHAALQRGVRDLCARDPHLARVVARHGPPPMWGRPPGFSTLIKIILEQQVSLASASAIYRRLQGTAGRVTAHRIVRFSDSEFRQSGLTRQKSTYCRNLARWIVEERLELAALESLEDAEVRERLIQVPGIGPWTADVYLLMALRRPDIWPPGDLALIKAAQEVRRMRRRPDGKTLERIVGAWSPWRSVGARVLWHHYLSVRKKSSHAASKSG